MDSMNDIAQERIKELEELLETETERLRKMLSAATVEANTWKAEYLRKFGEPDYFG